jgi:hypothetical protein
MISLATEPRDRRVQAPRRLIVATRLLLLAAAIILGRATIWPGISAAGTPADCAGDCNGDLRVAIDELVLGVNIALDRAAAEECTALDTDDNGSITINELVAAVNSALRGCPDATPMTTTPTLTSLPSPTGTPTPTTTPTLMPTLVPTNTSTSAPTSTATPVATREPTDTRTRTSVPFCGGSAPECDGRCPIRRFCEATAQGGCQCVDIDEPLR